MHLFYRCRPCVANKIILDILKKLQNILHSYAVNLLSLLLKKRLLMRYIYLICRKYMKIRYSALVLCMLTAHCFSMHNYSEETTLLLKQEFEKHIVKQTLPDLLTIRSFLQNNANPNILITASVF